jgi:glycosyltransferase involved in cell wall biosynthesis
MKIAIITETFSRRMGYLEQTLAKYLARCRAEVHVLTTDLHPYHQLDDFTRTYGSFAAGNYLPPGTVEIHDGFTLHVLPHQKMLGYMRMRGMRRKLTLLRPDVVQAFTAIGWLPFEAALLQPFLGFRLFIGNHTAASGFPAAQNQIQKWDYEHIKTAFTRTLPGRLVSWRAEKCYGVTSDCAEIAWRFFGVQRHKVETMHLGVDTDFFSPIRSEHELQQRRQLRSELGFEGQDIVCIYTGKLTENKNAQILARAVEKLRETGKSFRGLFIGEGTQEKLLRSFGSSVVLNFMDYRKLASYYRAADIGVWPSNESTSVLDAAACGLPVIVSDGIRYREHVDGNGLVFKMNDLDSLVATLARLCSPEERMRLGTFGAGKMLREFSMDYVAVRRLRDYELAAGKC